MVTKHVYSVKILEKGAHPRWPRLKGHIFEKDVLIGTFVRGALSQGYVPPIECKFYSNAAKTRFESFTNCLSTGETIEALAAGQI